MAPLDAPERGARIARSQRRNNPLRRQDPARRSGRIKSSARRLRKGLQSTMGGGRNAEPDPQPPADVRFSPGHPRRRRDSAHRGVFRWRPRRRRLLLTPPRSFLQGEEVLPMILRSMRFLGALALLAVGAVHLQQYIAADYRAIPTIGPLFLLMQSGRGAWASV